MIRVSISDTGKIYVTIPDDGPIRIRMVGIEPIRINAFNYPPEIDRLNQEVIEAKEDASSATELATQASQAATTATESANAAGNLASQAAQAVQEAVGIAESAADTAGQAAQSINEHASSTTNPHPANTTQSFAEVVITPLKSATNGGSVADADYNWFKGVYASLVDGSVLSWIKGLVNQVKSLATRVGLLEDKYILKYVVPVNTTSIELTTDKYGNAFNFVEGDTLQITFNIAAWTVITSNLARINMRINNISSSIYNVQNVVTLTEAITAGTNYKSQRTTITITLINNEVVGVISNQSINLTDVKVTEFYPFYTTGLNSSTISSLKLLLSNSNAMIPAGTVFLIKKI